MWAMLLLSPPRQSQSGDGREISSTSSRSCNPAVCRRQGRPSVESVGPLPRSTGFDCLLESEKPRQPRLRASDNKITLQPE